LVKDKIKFDVDSLSVANCLDTLAARVASQGNFDRIDILPVNTVSKSWVNDIKPAKAEWYKALVEENEADAIIILDMFSCFYSFTNGENSPEAKVVTSNIWSVYSAKSQRIADRFSQIDTLYWNQQDEKGNYKKLSIPDKKDAVALAAGVIGANYSGHILPSWKKVDRAFMLVDDNQLRRAVALAQKNEWEKAIAIWEEFSGSKNKRKQTSALYNLAVASEMNGDVDKAIEFTDKAAISSSGMFLGSVNEQVRKYSVVLYQRKNEITKLNQQYEAR